MERQKERTTGYMEKECRINLPSNQGTILKDKYKWKAAVRTRVEKSSWKSNRSSGGPATFRGKKKKKKQSLIRLEGLTGSSKLSRFAKACKGGGRHGGQSTQLGCERGEDKCKGTILGDQQAKAQAAETRSSSRRYWGGKMQKVQSGQA